MSELSERERTQPVSIDSYLAQERTKHARIQQLLWVGGPESGSRNIFRKIAGEYTQQQQQDVMIPRLHQQIVAICKRLCEYSDKLSFDYPECTISLSGEASRKAILAVDDQSQTIDSVLGQHVQTLWHDAGIQNTYDQLAARGQAPDKALRLFVNLKEILQGTYLLSEEDRVLVGESNAGVVEEVFDVVCEVCCL